MAVEDESKDSLERSKSVEPASNDGIETVERADPQPDDSTDAGAVVELSFDAEEASAKTESAYEHLRDSLSSISIDMDRSLYGGVTAAALADIDVSGPYNALRDTLSSISIDMDRLLYGGVTAAALANIDVSGPYNAFRDSLSSSSIDMDRSLYGVTAGLANIDTSGPYYTLRDSLGNISINVDRALYRGTTAAALANINVSGPYNALCDSLSSISIDMGRSLHGVTAALANIDMSAPYNALRDSLNSINLDRLLYGGITAAALANVDASKLYGSLPATIARSPLHKATPARQRSRQAGRRASDNRVERVHEYVERKDLSILITLPANEHEVLISVAKMSAAYRLLHCFEVRLREVISSLMESKFGADWMRTRVSPNIVALWEEKKAKAEQKGFIAWRLLDYADFADYLGIIVQRNNWRDAFQPIFGNQKDTEVSFERLQPLRIEAMHNRRLTRTDAAVLATEVHRLLRKFDRWNPN